MKRNAMGFTYLNIGRTGVNYGENNHIVSFLPA